jgi:hypothetical protein
MGITIGHGKGRVTDNGAELQTEEYFLWKRNFLKQPSKNGLSEVGYLYRLKRLSKIS